jgi:arylsulfatase
LRFFDFHGRYKYTHANIWPGHIKDQGALREQFCHVIDIVPTLLEVCGISAHESVDGIKQSPIEGTSLAYTFDLI